MESKHKRKPKKKELEGQEERKKKRSALTMASIVDLRQISHRTLTVGHSLLGSRK